MLWGAIQIKMWIEPLNLELWIINVLSGSSEIFTAIALIMIFSLAGYFRMGILTTILILGMFLVIFSGYVDISIYYLVIVISATLIGFGIKRIVSTN